MKVRELIKHLVDNYELEEEIFPDLWSTEDIQLFCEQNNYYPLSETKLAELAENIKVIYDPEQGINYEVISYALNGLVEEKENKS